MKPANLISLLTAKKPTQAALLLTYRCNSRCSWCNSWQKPKSAELTLPEIKMILEKMKKFGIKLLYLSGGEPLVKKDLLAIAAIAADLGFDQILATNGILLTPLTTKKLVKIPNLKINISLDSLQPKKYQQIRGVNALEKVKENLSLFKKNYPRYPLRITMTVSAANIDEAGQIYRFCQKKGFYFSPNPYFGYGRFRQSRQLHQYGQSINKAIKYYQDIEQMAKTDPYLSGWPLVYRRLIDWLENKPTGPCGAGEELLYLDPQGLVYACQDLPPFADLKEQDLEKEWRAKKWQPAVRKCYQTKPCFTFCTRSPYLVKHELGQIVKDLLASKKILHYFKMY